METLEQRRLLTGTLVTGSASADVNEPYVLNLNAVPQGAGGGWAFDWGDGTTGAAGGDARTATHAYAAPGTYGIAASISPFANPLDPTFGAGGKVSTDLGWTDDHAFDVALQPDGRIVVAGGPSFSLARYNADGSVDLSFGTDGRVTEAGADHAYAVAVLPDGKILVGGGTNFALARFNADGSVDPTFGGGAGRTVSGFGASYVGYDMAVLPGGKIVVVGRSYAHFAVARFNADGSVDAAFGTGGKVTTDFAGSLDKAFAVAVQADGKIVAVGQERNGASNYNWALARYAADGALDPTFGTGGKVTTEFGSDDDAAWAVQVLPDGRIVVAGRGGSAATGYDFAAARYEPNGSLDPSFGTGGTVALDFGHGGDYAYALRALPDGKLLLAGRAQSASRAMNFALARLDAFGAPDATFGTGGTVSTDFFGSSDQIEAVALDADGRAVAAGAVSTVGTSATDFGLARYTLAASGTVSVAVGGADPTDVPDAPTDFAATSAGPTSIALSWQYSGGAGGVGGFRATLHPIDGGEDVVAIFPAGATGGTVEGLAPNTEYAPTLAALPPEGSASEETPAAEAPVVRTDPLLTTVQSPYTLEGARFAIQLDAHGYAVRKWLLDWGDGITQVVAPADGSPTTVAGHTYADDGTYEIKVSVADERGTFAAEPVSLEVRDAAATVSVAGLVPGTALIPGTAYTVRLTHADPGALDVPTYAIDWGDGSTTGADANGITASHVYAAMDRYAIRVTATDPNGVVAAAAPLMVGQDVSAPTDLAATGVDETGATFAWTDTTGGATGTDIEYKLAADARDVWVRAETFLPGITSGRVGVDHPYPEDTFTFRARASSGFATGVSNAVTRTLAGARIGLPAVAGVTASAVPDNPDDPNDHGGIDVYVPKSEGAAGDVFYEYELVDHAPLDPFLTEWRSVSGLGMADDGTRTGFLHGSTGGRQGVRHTVRVRTWAYAADGSGRVFSPWSDPQDLTTTGKSPAAPAVTAVATSPTSVAFGFEAGAYAYQYYAKQLYRGQLPYRLESGPDGHSQSVIGGLAPGTTYRFAVRQEYDYRPPYLPESAAQFITVTTPAAAVLPPRSPDALTPTQRRGENGYAIDLAWRDTTTPLWSGGYSSDSPADFLIERAEMHENGIYGPTPGPYAPVGSAAANTPFFTDATALPEVEYAYRVRARNAGGLSYDRPENNAGARITVPRLNLFSDVPVAGERAGDPGQFVFERDGDLSGELPIKFDPVDLPDAHNAVPGDYDLSSTDGLKFAAGQRFAFLSVTAAIDGVPEFPEALAVALGASSAYKPPDGQRPSTRATSGPAVVTIPDVPVDLDVDSDNSGEVDRSAEEDAIEDRADAPGKYIAVNDGDSDHDGVVDFSDGFKTKGGVAPGGTAGGEAFVPLKLELAEDVDLSAARVRFTYSASDPRKLTRDGAGTDASPYYYTPGIGRLRLWTRPGDEARSGEPAGAGGGDWIESGGEYKLSDLRFDGRSGTLHVEAVAPGASTGDPRITVELDPDGPGGPMPFAAADAVRMTAVAADIDIDSLNTETSAQYMTADSQAQDQIEDLEVSADGKRLPGKVVLVNDGDRDGDGVLDYSDGFNADGIPSVDDQPPSPTSGYRFTPLSISIPAPVDLSKARLQIDYDASVPGAGAGGSLRLWTKNDDDQLGRNKNSFTTAGGNYVPKKAGSDYYSPADLMKLGLSNDARMKELFIEGIASSTQAGDKRIIVRVDPDGPGPAGFVAIDAVRLTTIRVDLDVNHNDSLDDPVDGVVNYLPGYEGTTDKLSTGNTFNTVKYTGQATSLMVQGLGSGTVIDQINFIIESDVTRLDGFAANKSDKSLEDYSGVAEEVIARADDFSFRQGEDDRAQAGIMKDGKTTVPFWAKDYGGWATVRVTAKVGENTFTLREFTVPNDSDGDKIADAWERAKVKEWNKQFGESRIVGPAFFSATDNKEPEDPDGANTDGGINQPPQKTVGDGLDVSHEYRGYIADGTAVPVNGSAFAGGHLRLSPAYRDLLVEVDMMAGVAAMPSAARIRTIVSGVSSGFFNTTNGNGLNTTWLLDETAAPNVAFAKRDDLTAYMAARKNTMNSGFVPLVLANKIVDNTNVKGTTLPANKGGGSFAFVDSLATMMPTTGTAIDPLLLTTCAHELLHNLLDAVGAPGFATDDEHVIDGNENGVDKEVADKAYLMYPAIEPSTVGTILCSNADRKELDFKVLKFVAATKR